MFTCSYVTPKLVLSKNIAIVGSSSELLLKKRGNFIDDHDEVLRFNKAITDNYEEFVGSKTTLRVTNNVAFGNIDNKPNDFYLKNITNSKILHIGNKKFNQQDINNFIKNKNKYTNNTNSLYMFNYKKYGNQLKTDVSYSSPKDFSSGFLAICLIVIKNIVPNLFGFDIDETSSNRNHYWEQHSSQKSIHNVSYEKQFIKQLINDEKVKLF